MIDIEIIHKLSSPDLAFIYYTFAQGRNRPDFTTKDPIYRELIRRLQVYEDIQEKAKLQYVTVGYK